MSIKEYSQNIFMEEDLSNYHNFKRRSLSATALTAIALTPFYASAADGDRGSMMDEIVVTASKREESVQDIPYNITAATGDALEKIGAVDLTRLARIVPGMATVDRGPRENTIVAIRGLTVDESSPSGNDSGGTVAAYINDTPINLDFKLLDINRVEVLRGPQGTLYGAGSLGGTIRYITNKPDTSEISAEAHGKLYTTKESSGVSYDVDAVINLPIIKDKMAFRAVFGYVDEKGFIDYNHILVDPENSLATKKVQDLNFEKTISVRASILLDVNDDIEVMASYFYQQTKTGGRQVANIPFTGDKYTAPSRYEEPNKRTSQLFTLDFSWDFGFAELTSATGFQKFSDLGQRDQTDLLLNLDYGYDAFPFFSAFTEEITDDKKFTEELRLVSKHEGPIQWIVGAFYTQEDNFETSKEFTPGFPEFIPFNRPDDLEYFSWDIGEVREYAFFGELSYDITEDFTITGGIRHFNLKEELESCLAFPLFLGPEGTGVDFECSGAGIIEGNPYPDGTGVGPDLRDYREEDPNNPGTFLDVKPIKDTFFKLNLDYHITEDVMVYGTFSQGFRRGGANAVPEGGQVGNLPDHFLRYLPDTVDNFELGVKSTLFDDKLVLNVNVFLLNWNDLQLSTSTGEEFGFIPVTVNGGKARSSGVELEAKAMIAENFVMNIAYSYTNARLTEDAPLIELETAGGDEIFALDGNRVPLVPRHKFYIGMDYFQPLSNSNGEIRYHLDASFTDSMPSALNPLARDFEKVAGYEIVNASVSYQQDNWSVSLFADNLFNNYATFGGRHEANATLSGPQGAWRFVNRPRTFGLDFRGSF